jgi:hypothetical protein
VAKTRVFISFDYDHDLDLRNLLAGQAKLPDSPFEISDWSVKVASVGWKDDARRRISASSQCVVLCGHHTNTATGVSEEIKMARAVGKPYFLLGGRSSGVNRKPAAALTSDKIYDWTWPNLKLLIAGGR